MLSYSGIQGFSYPLFFGILSILLSFGKGIIFSFPDYYYFLTQKLESVLILDLKPHPVGLLLGAIS